MIASKGAIRSMLSAMINYMAYQGYDTQEAAQRFPSLPDSYDCLIDFAHEVRALPMRSDWRYVEPMAWEDVAREMHPQRMRHETAAPNDAKQRVHAAFIGSVLGCMLGKPLEIDADMHELKRAGMACGQWPLTDWVSEAFLEKLGRRHPTWHGTTLGSITCAVPDDDIHYTVLGMLNLERFGSGLSTDGVRQIWQRHQNINYTWGAERAIMTRIAVSFLNDHAMPPLTVEEYALWAETINPTAESCGAAIRADAYGYAFPGRPDEAARLAFIDASFTHRRTGVYSAMFIAAALAVMPMVADPMAAFEAALDYVPQNSRFYEITRSCMDIVAQAGGFEEAYEQIHARYSLYRHCHVYQEIGTLINTLKHAESIWHGVCLQVMQGGDTDSFGATAGSLLGMRFGPAGHDADRVKQLHDTIRLDLLDFPPMTLDALATRMSKLSTDVLQR